MNVDIFICNELVISHTLDFGSPSVFELDVLNGIAALKLSSSDLDGFSSNALKKYSSSVPTPLI